MITKIHRQNIQALIRQENPTLLMIIDAYKSGNDVSELLEGWKGGGTTGEAIAEHLKNNVKKTPKRKAKVAKEVNNG